MTTKISPAYRIESPRLVIRCWEPKDAPLIKKAIDESREHLKPWMPWANVEPESLETHLDRLRNFRGNFDLDQDYVYGIFDKKETKVLGGTGLHGRVGKFAKEIGYWIHADHIKRGYATEVVLSLMQVGFNILKLKRIEIHCDPKNIGSAAVPKKIGYELEAVLKKRQPFLDRQIDIMIWTMFYEDYIKSPAASFKIKAHDAGGRKLNLS